MKKIFSLSYLIFSIYFAGCGVNDCESWAHTYVINQTFDGLIKGKFKDKNHAAETLIVGDSSYTVYAEGLYSFSVLGDSITKKKGSLVHMLKRGNKSYYFYPNCGNGPIRK